MAIKGLAMATDVVSDASLLNCGWFYRYGFTYPGEPNEVPMSIEGNMVNLPNDYAGYLMMFNEPSGQPPNGHPVSYTEAAIRYRAMLNAYPQAKLVVGGAYCWDSVYDGSWLKGFKKVISCLGCKHPAAYHVHGYREDWLTTSTVEKFWTKQHTLLGTDIWISEFNDISGNITNLKKLVTWIRARSWIKRYALFTNRSNHEPWAIGNAVNCVNQDGSLTELGSYYTTIPQS